MHRSAPCSTLLPDRVHTSIIDKPRSVRPRNGIEPRMKTPGMSDLPDSLDQCIEQDTRVVRGLMAALYAHNDTEPDESLLSELAEAKAALRELQQRRDTERAEAGKGQVGPKK